MIKDDDHLGYKEIKIIILLLDGETSTIDAYKRDNSVLAVHRSPIYDTWLITDTISGVAIGNNFVSAKTAKQVASVIERETCWSQMPRNIIFWGKHYPSRNYLAKVDRILKQIEEAK